jgi:hypothetical protein
MSRPELFGLVNILGGILVGCCWNRLKADNRGPNRPQTGRDRLRRMIRERLAPESGL